MTKWCRSSTIMILTKEDKETLFISLKSKSILKYCIWTSQDILYIRWLWFLSSKNILTNAPLCSFQNSKECLTTNSSAAESKNQDTLIQIPLRIMQRWRFGLKWAVEFTICLIGRMNMDVKMSLRGIGFICIAATPKVEACVCDKISIDLLSILKLFRENTNSTKFSATIALFKLNLRDWKEWRFLGIECTAVPPSESSPASFATSFK